MGGVFLRHLSLFSFTVRVHRMSGMFSRSRLLAWLTSICALAIILIGYQWASAPNSVTRLSKISDAQPSSAPARAGEKSSVADGASSLTSTAERGSQGKTRSPSVDEQATRAAGLCLRIDGPANVRNEPSGRQIASLPDSSYVRLDTVAGAWRRIRYTQGQTEHACNRTDAHSTVGWTHAANLPYMGTLAYDLQPQAGPLFGGTLAFGKRRNLDSLYEAGELLGTGVFYGEQTLGGVGPYRMWESANDEVAFWWIYTGRTDLPYALLYSGWLGDTEGEVGWLTLFGNGETRTWTPWRGNRVEAWLHDVRDDEIVVREGFHCMLPVRNVLAISDSGTVERRRGRFTRSEADRYRSFNRVGGYTERPLPLRPHLSSRDTTFVRVDSMAWQNRLPGGPKPNLQFLQVRYDADSTAHLDEHQQVQVIIDGHVGWASMDAIRSSIPALFGRACCGCG